MSKRIEQAIKDRVIDKLKSDGLTVKQASTEFGLSPNTIYGWLGTRATGDPSVMEIAKLRRENNELKQFGPGFRVSIGRTSNATRTTGRSRFHEPKIESLAEWLPRIILFTIQTGTRFP